MCHSTIEVYVLDDDMLAQDKILPDATIVYGGMLLCGEDQPFLSWISKRQAFTKLCSKLVEDRQV